MWLVQFIVIFGPGFSLLVCRLVEQHCFRYKWNCLAVHVKHTCAHTSLLYTKWNHCCIRTLLIFFFNLVSWSLWGVAVNKPCPDRASGDLGHGFLCIFHGIFILTYNRVPKHPGPMCDQVFSPSEVTYGRYPCGPTLVALARIAFSLG